MNLTAGRQRNRAFKYCDRRGQEREEAAGFIWARAPEFFGASGFKEVERADAPEFFECFDAVSTGVKCFPKVMEYILTEE